MPASFVSRLLKGAFREGEFSVEDEARIGARANCPELARANARIGAFWEGEFSVEDGARIRARIARGSRAIR